MTMSLISFQSGDTCGDNVNVDSKRSSIQWHYGVKLSYKHASCDSPIVTPSSHQSSLDEHEMGFGMEPVPHVRCMQIPYCTLAIRVGVTSMGDVVLSAFHSRFLSERGS